MSDFLHVHSEVQPVQSDPPDEGASGVRSTSSFMYHTRDLTIYTIGHSSRPEMEFLRLLRGYAIRHLVDVRKFSTSQKYPQFNAENLMRSAAAIGCEYHHITELSGYRTAVPGSVSQAWRNASLRGFADYMQTPEFDVGIDQLLEIAKQGTAVIMCSEALPWHCHRSLISDALVARGVDVLDIFSLTQAEEHHLTPFANVKKTKAGILTERAR